VAEVRLVDLEVIKRYSLAVRRDTVPAEELLEALEASQAAVRAALGVSPPPSAARRASARPTPRPRAASGKGNTPADEAAKAPPPARKAASRRGGA
jgi:hypothetical protein